MTTCPKCKAEHGGARPMEQTHYQLKVVIARAAELTLDEARSYLRVHCLRVWAELSDFCPNCILTAQGDVAGAVSFETVAAVREAEEALQAVGEPVHLCKVLPLRRPAAAPERLDPSWPKGGW